MSSASRIVLLFSLASLVFLIGPSLLPEPLPIYPAMTVGEALDLATPIALLPLYWALLVAAGDGPPSRSVTLLFLALAAAWAEGHGLHLSANAISRHAKGSAGEPASVPAAAVAAFFDERLSHILWHAAMIALSGLIMWREKSARRTGEGGGVLPRAIASAAFGFTFFAVVVEGRTAVLGVPFAILVTLVGFAARRGGRGRGPVFTFFWTSYLVSSALLAVWWARWGGLPEFSALGLIK